ncbi:541_t:CDS:2, partial [Ambispora leptoticha]
VDALQREIALLKELQHENIVQYLGCQRDDETLNIFLEYVPGGSVTTILNNYGALEEPLVRSFVRQILQGLEYLHGKDIIHRDIKGANVLVDNKGRIKISDFGISKKVEDQIRASISVHRPSLQGSIFWMAPEVIKQTAYTSKADIWSLGCLIVEMFTRNHPFPEFNQMQAMFKIGTQSCAPEIPENISDEAKDFLKKTFEPNHNDRPTANELSTHPFAVSN